MSAVLHRDLRGRLATAVSGQGPYLFDSAGRRYLDASGGAAVSCLGHGHPKVTQAIVDQARALAFAHTSFFTNEPLERLAQRLVEVAPPGFSRVGVVSGGSEAVEAAFKLARQYWVEKGEESRSWIVARHNSYHGNTLGALAASGHPGRRRLYAPLLFDKVERIAACYPYRLQHAGESPEAYGRRAADELETAIERLGPRNVAAFIAEPIVGATSGVLLPAPGYFRRIREICDRTGVLFIADEILCGLGRTGTMFACEAEDVVPDIITVAKGLGAGYQPIGAYLANERIVSALQAGTGHVAHGHTYMGHPIACAAALAVQDAIRDEQLLERVRTMGALLERRLRERFSGHPHIGDIRGRGLLWGLELVENRETKAPFDPGLALHARVKREALQRGLLCYPSGGTVDGGRGDHVLLAPPYIVDESHLDELVIALEGALGASLPARVAVTVA